MKEGASPALKNSAREREYRRNTVNKERVCTMVRQISASRYQAMGGREEHPSQQPFCRPSRFMQNRFVQEEMERRKSGLVKRLVPVQAAHHKVAAEHTKEEKEEARKGANGGRRL